MKLGAKNSLTLYTDKPQNKSQNRGTVSLAKLGHQNIHIFPNCGNGPKTFLELAQMLKMCRPNTRARKNQSVKENTQIRHQSFQQEEIFKQYFILK